MLLVPPTLHWPRPCLVGINQTLQHTYSSTMSSSNKCNHLLYIPSTPWHDVPLPCTLSHVPFSIKSSPTEGWRQKSLFSTNCKLDNLKWTLNGPGLELDNDCPGGWHWHWEAKVINASLSMHCVDLINAKQYKAFPINSLLFMPDIIFYRLRCSSFTEITDMGSRSVDPIKMNSFCNLTAQPAPTAELCLRGIR